MDLEQTKMYSGSTQQLGLQQPIKDEQAWKSFLKDYTEKPLEIEHLSARYNFFKLFSIIKADSPNVSPSVSWMLPRMDWQMDEFPCFAFKINLLFLQWVSDQVRHLGCLDIQIAIQDHCLMIYQWFFDKFLIMACQVTKQQWVKDMEAVQKGTYCKQPPNSKKNKKSDACLQKKKEKRQLKIQQKISMQRQKLIQRFEASEKKQEELKPILEDSACLLQIARFEENCDKIAAYSRRFEPLYQKEANKIKQLSQKNFISIYNQASSLEEAQEAVKTLISSTCYDFDE